MNHQDDVKRLTACAGSWPITASATKSCMRTKQAISCILAGLVLNVGLSRVSGTPTTSSSEDAKPTPVPKTWSFGSPVPEEVVRSTRLLRERLLADPYRPGYHFCIPEDIMTSGDPNGAFYRNGRYHLMYLYNRTGSGFYWGHISSLDLVHWRHHPDAIGPGQGDQGCWSGGTFVDDDGTAYLSY